MMEGWGYSVLQFPCQGSPRAGLVRRLLFFGLDGFAGGFVWGKQVNLGLKRLGKGSDYDRI